jgi:polysaccharide pyruvyl transferase WcaK-like protein
METVEINPRIIIIGYYYHDNVGDEQYIETFETIFSKYFPQTTEKIFVDCDKILDFPINETDIIIVGGGDVLNNYFLDKINEKFLYSLNKIIAVSVGMPYLGILVNTTKLNIIDYVFIRTKQDFEVFSQYFCSTRIYYIPDISYLLLLNNGCNNNDETNVVDLSNKNPLFSLKTPPFYLPPPLPPFDKLLLKTKKRKNKGNKIVCFSLNRHIYTEKTKEIYQTIIDEFCKVCKGVLEKGYVIYFIPFNTTTNNASIKDANNASIKDANENTNNDDTNMENDIILHTEICNQLRTNLTPNQLKNVVNIQFKLTAKEILQIYDYSYLSVPMRFHSTLFSIYKNLPFIPIYTTRKIHNVLLDIQYPEIYSYEMKTDNNDIPIEFNSDLFIEKLHSIVKICNYNKIEQLLTEKNIQIRETIKQVIPKLISVMKQHDIKKINTSINQNNHSIINSLLLKINNIASSKDFRKETDPKKMHKIVVTTSYFLTNELHSKYNCGLMEKMFLPNYNYMEEWNWIIKDVQLNVRSLPNHLDGGFFNINYINQEDKSGVHRSGWNYVYEKLAKYHNKNHSIYLDMYVDRTFHWEKDNFKTVGLIPYSQPWMGFIHHTFDTTFSEYNNVNLLKTFEFVKSLEYCNGLFVLSKTLEIKLKEELKKIGFESIPVFSFVHPTETNIVQFDYSLFLKNKKKKLLHIGGWLRNVFSFYNLCLPEEITFSTTNISTIKRIIKNETIIFNKCKVTKTIIKNKNGDNYIPSPYFKENMKKLLGLSFSSPIFNGGYISSSSGGGGGGESEDGENISNNWNKHFYEFIKDMIEHTDVIENISNDEYDKYLSENIVFINLVDSSAVNTIIECIVRNTPIIVNKHPAVVELLGETYPLYFTSSSNNYFKINKQVEDIFENPNNIFKAHQYLKKLDKTKYYVDTFIENFLHCM